MNDIYNRGSKLNKDQRWIYVVAMYEWNDIVYNERRSRSWV